MTRDEVFKRLTSIFRDAFIDDTLVLDEGTSANDIDEWDSLMQITLITAIENDFDVQFTLNDVLKLKNVGDMVDLIIKVAGDEKV